jgi:DNA-binding transcriptional ArsR family regulator
MSTSDDADRRNRDIDPEAYRTPAAVCAALGNEKRIELVALLARGPLSAADLRDRTGLSRSSLSQHMSILAAQGLVKTRANGRYVNYELACAAVSEVYRAVAKLCRERLEDMRSLARQL